MSLRCSLSPGALLITTITAADATAYEMPMIASCGTLASCPRIIEKISAPMIVNPRLIQYTLGLCGSPPSAGTVIGDGRAERRNLRERQVDEDDAALDHVQAEVRVNAGDDEARRDRRGEELEDGRVQQDGLLSGDLLQGRRELIDVVLEELDVVGRFLHAARPTARARAPGRRPGWRSTAVSSGSSTARRR